MNHCPTKTIFDHLAWRINKMSVTEEETCLRSAEIDRLALNVLVVDTKMRSAILTIIASTSTSLPPDLPHSMSTCDINWIFAADVFHPKTRGRNWDERLRWKIKWRLSRARRPPGQKTIQVPG